MENVKRIVKLALVALLLMVMLPILNASFESKIQTIPVIDDPTPGYWETSEYMIGSVAVGIIFPESNGTIDPSTEDWTETEEQQITNKVNDALDWWASQNPDANVSFVTKFDIVDSSYELINHSVSDPTRVQIYNELFTNLGYPGEDPLIQMYDCINDLRETYSTDWGFIMVINDASNDADGLYPDKVGGFSIIGGPYSQMPVKTTNYLEWGVAHEMGHIFWATDEYKGGTEYSGYLNVPDVEDSGGLMWDPRAQYHFLSGKPQGLEGTWGQIGWRDSDGDGIQDIVDTFPKIYLNSPEITQARVNYTGVTAVTSTQNKNPWPKNPEGKRDVTINKIKSIEFRVDSGDWTPATPTDGSFGNAIENFTFVTEELSPGQHFIEVRATNQWGNSGYANQTVEVHEFLPIDLNKDGTVNIVDISIVAIAFGTKPGDGNWNPKADLDKNEEVNIIDISMVAMDYGKST